MARSGVGIIIPALNEAQSIAKVVEGARQFGTVIVVDDGSSDGTGAVAAAAGAEVVRHPLNLGYDAALGSGFERAAALSCDAVVTLDADGQHDPQLLAQFIAALETGASVVAGVRDRCQRIAERLFAWVTRIRWGIHDPLCGMKGYQMAVYRELGHFDSYGSIGTELALFAARRGMRLVEIPVRTRERVGAPRFGRRLSANWRILRALILSQIPWRPLSRSCARSA
jgi:glycosyltransferase involved in cell wall biosynthesis